MTCIRVMWGGEEISFPSSFLRMPDRMLYYIEKHTNIPKEHQLFFNHPEDAEPMKLRHLSLSDHCIVYLKDAKKISSLGNVESSADPKATCTSVRFYEEFVENEKNSGAEFVKQLEACKVVIDTAEDSEKAELSRETRKLKSSMLKMQLDLEKYKESEGLLNNDILKSKKQVFQLQLIAAAIVCMLLYMSYAIDAAFDSLSVTYNSSSVLSLERTNLRTADSNMLEVTSLKTMDVKPTATDAPAKIYSIFDTVGQSDETHSAVIPMWDISAEHHPWFNFMAQSVKTRSEAENVNKEAKGGKNFQLSSDPDHPNESEKSFFLD